MLFRTAAEKRRAEAVAAAAAAEEATKAVQASIAQVEQQLAEAEAELTKLKQSSSSPRGYIWWQQRVLEDKKRSLPQRLW